MITNISKFTIVVFMLLSSKMALLATDSLTVYFFMLDECRICQELAPEINAIHQKYSAKSIGFVGLFPNFASKPSGIDRFKKKYNILFMTKTDYYKKMCHKFDAEILPTVVVFNETSQKLEYKGAINDLFYQAGKRRHQVSQHYLRDALDSLILGKSPELKQTQAVGCYINFNDNLINN
jgi:thiol-disulfide isomerase/thioredoxin